MNSIPTISVTGGFLFCSLLASLPATAQVTTDGTTSTTVNADGNNFEINDGDRAGGNLFHSFRDFSVRNGGEAFFNNANDIVNIFSRVTGGNISNIDGLLRANGGANLFLINPNGIIFGNNARLDIGGSFYGTSADSILFEDGEFSATDLDNPPLLTINAPIGLSLRDNPGDIVNRSNFGLTETVLDETINPALAGTQFTIRNSIGLQVNPSQSINLIGGNVILEDAAGITAPGGRIELGGLSQAGVITFNNDGSLIFPEGVARGDVSLTGQSRVNVTAGNGGFINVNAKNLILSEQSELFAGIAEDMGSPEAQAGDITINATESVRLTGSGGIGQNPFLLLFNDYDTAIRNVVGLRPNDPDEPNLGRNPKPNSTAIGNSGEIIINTGLLEIKDRASLTAKTYGLGNTGNLEIRANEIIIDRGDVLNQIVSGEGNSGDINLVTNDLTVIGSPEGFMGNEGDSSFILTDTRSTGDTTGDININAANNINLQGGSLIQTQILENARGNAGDINISANSFTGTGAEIQTNSKGIGAAGNINISADNGIILDNVLVNADIEKNARGNAGDINISANSLSLNNNSTLQARILGQGNAGDIIINTQDNILISNNAGIFSEVGENATGNGGDIFLTTGELNLTNQTRILANTSGRSPSMDNLSTAGNINIDVSGDINLENGNNIQSQVLGEAVGIAGDITINTGGSLFSTGGNEILADSQATGNGGNINITAGEQIVLEGFQSMGFPSQIVVGLTEDADGTGGNITISASELVLSDVAFIAANNTSTSTGAAGNITINVDRLQLTENAFINATTNNNSLGGSIDITAQTLDLSSGGKIAAATSGRGDAGNIDLNVSDRIEIDNNVESSARFVEFDSNSQLLNDLQAEGSGIFANATETATGNAGNITIGSLPNQFPEELIISNDAQIVVNSEGTGSGGSIFIRSENIELNNNASISASTEAIRGGEITLNIADNLVLENNSSISAEAGSNADGGNINGGNINIDTNFIVAFPNQNNDIIADAQQGNGGNINITAEAVFNIEERPLNDFTNDINASSALGAQFDGNVAITIPDINAIQTETQVPNNLIESQQTTEQACQSDRINAAKNGLNILGKGGIPPEAIEPLQADNIIIDQKFAANYIPPEIEPIETDNGDIYPARGIIKTADGGIILTAYPTENIPTRTPIIKPNCN